MAALAIILAPVFLFYGWLIVWGLFTKDPSFSGTARDRAADLWTDVKRVAVVYAVLGTLLAILTSALR